MLSLREFAVLEQLEELQNPVLVATVNPVYYNDATTAVTGFLLKKCGKGVYVSLNKPVEFIRRLLEQASLHTSNLIFLDAITSRKLEETENNTTYLGPNQDLTNLSLALAKALAQVKPNGFLVLDSLSTLLIYNDERSVSRFAHLLAEKLRTNAISAVLLTVQSSSERDMVSRLAQFSDRLITLGEELPKA